MVYSNTDSNKIANEKGGKKMCKLREFRTQKGLSQEKMAAKLGISTSMYAKVEQGTAKAGRAFMEKVKNHYPEASIDDIFFTLNSNNIAVM